MPMKIRVAGNQYVGYWLSNIPKDDQDYLPRELILGSQWLDCKNICQIPFGAYEQVRNDK